MDFFHFIALSSAFLGGAFVLNNFLTYIYDLPGFFGTLALIGINIGEINSNTSFTIKLLGVFQTISYVAAIVYPISIIYKKIDHRDEKMPNNISEIFVASGVVLDSTSRKEYAENYIKAKSILDIFKK